METSVERMVAINFLVIGLSHLLQPRVWTKFFVLLRDKQEVGSFLNGFVHFPLGAFILAFHNVWHGFPVIVTIIGCGLTLKGVIYFLFPQLGARILSTFTPEKSWRFVAGGMISVALGAAIMYRSL